MYDFANVVNIEPSTMQTKIRTMIRYGFVKEGNVCPLVWTRMGSLWNDLYTIGNFDAAVKIYKLTLCISLAIYAFNDSPSQFSYNPSKGDMPLKFLLNNLDINNSISLAELQALVDGNTTRVGHNISYWKRDIINIGLFLERNGRLVLTTQFSSLVEDIKNFTPNPLLNINDWNEIRNNPLTDNSPFKVSFRQIFEAIAEVQNIEEQITDGILTEPLVEAISEQEEFSMPEIDILSTNTHFMNSTKRIRNSTWSIRIKRKYEYKCAVPNCDAEGKLFVESSHIKPDNLPENGTPHRSHILNGICLCRHCHIAFDKGYFSLTDNHKVVTSPKFNEIADQHLKTVIISSNNEIIKNRLDRRMPLIEFVQYHRHNIFKN
jgi:predicted restriction endonuclease